METSESQDKSGSRDRGQETRSHFEAVLQRRTLRQDSRLGRAEDLFKRGLGVVWLHAKRRPYLSAIVIGTSIAMAGASLGVTELALGVVATYGALEVLKGTETLEQFFGEIVHERT
jgi:hypothetical protein